MKQRSGKPLIATWPFPVKPLCITFNILLLPASINRPLPTSFVHTSPGHGAPSIELWCFILLFRSLPSHPFLCAHKLFPSVGFQLSMSFINQSSWLWWGGAVKHVSLAAVALTSSIQEWKAWGTAECRVYGSLTSGAHQSPTKSLQQMAQKGLCRGRGSTTYPAPTTQKKGHVQGGGRHGVCDLGGAMLRAVRNLQETILAWRVHSRNKGEAALTQNIEPYTYSSNWWHFQLNGVALHTFTCLISELL